MASLSVFGTKPANSIYCGAIPYAVRWNCAGAGGGLFVGGFDADHRRTSPKEPVEISIIKASRYFGTLGQTVNELWLQLFFVPAPTCTALPRNQVCVSYLKKQSVNNLMHAVAEAMDSGEPAAGIFTAQFEKQQGQLGQYFTIRFAWRERQTEEELLQLELIEGFMTDQPQLLDLTGTRDMVCIDGWRATDIVALIEERSHAQRLLPQS